ncbi:MAG: hypothetical protein JOY85_23290 [Acidobacteriaceae bacterium]|nr:hypothetical protein [Acidobacteriaceae bacterium]
MIKWPKLTSAERLLWAWPCSAWCPHPQSLPRHRLISEGFSLVLDLEIRRGKLGRLVVPKEVRELIRRMSRENPLTAGN